MFDGFMREFVCMREASRESCSGFVADSRFSGADGRPSKLLGGAKYVPSITLVPELALKLPGAADVT